MSIIESFSNDQGISQEILINNVIQAVPTEEVTETELN